MKKYRCKYFLSDREAWLDIQASGCDAAICIALDHLSKTEFRRMELSDENGLIVFRQAVPRLVYSREDGGPPSPGPARPFIRYPKAA